MTNSIYKFTVKISEKFSLESFLTELAKEGVKVDSTKKTGNRDIFEVFYFKEADTISKIDIIKSKAKFEGK